jgi:hypothetical protein
VIAVLPPAPPTSRSFRGARLREHINAVLLTTTVVPPIFRPIPASTQPVYRPQWFDDLRLLSGDELFDPEYYVPPNRLVPDRKKLHIADAVIALVPDTLSVTGQVVPLYKTPRCYIPFAREEKPEEFEPKTKNWVFKGQGVYHPDCGTGVVMQELGDGRHSTVLFFDEVRTVLNQSLVRIPYSELLGSSPAPVPAEVIEPLTAVIPFHYIDKYGDSHTLWVPQTTLTPAEPRDGCTIVVSSDRIKTMTDPKGCGTTYFYAEPELKLKVDSNARTKKGIAKFREQRELDLLVRRIQYQVSEIWLKEAWDEARPRDNDGRLIRTGLWNDYQDNRDVCKECGGTFFLRKAGKLKCFDCHTPLREGKVRDNTKREKYLKSLGFGDGTGYGIFGDVDKRKKQGGQDKGEFIAKLRTHFNPNGLTWAQAGDSFQDILDDEDFLDAANQYAIEFDGETVKDKADELGVKPNTLSKQISRRELRGIFHGINFADVSGFFCIVKLKNENRLIHLGDANDSLPDVLARFLREWRKSEINAVKFARKQAKKYKWSHEILLEEEKRARGRVFQSYDVVIGHFRQLGELECEYTAYGGVEGLALSAVPFFSEEVKTSLLLGFLEEKSSLSDIFSVLGGTRWQTNQ